MALTAGAAAGRASGGWTGDQKGTGRAWAGVEAGRVAIAWHRRGERLMWGARAYMLGSVGLKFL